MSADEKTPFKSKNHQEIGAEDSTEQKYEESIFDSLLGQYEEISLSHNDSPKLLKSYFEEDVVQNSSLNQPHYDTQSELESILQFRSNDQTSFEENLPYFAQSMTSVQTEDNSSADESKADSPDYADSEVHHQDDGSLPLELEAREYIAQTVAEQVVVAELVGPQEPSHSLINVDATDNFVGDTGECSEGSPHEDTSQSVEESSTGLTDDLVPHTAGHGGDSQHLHGNTELTGDGVGVDISIEFAQQPSQSACETNVQTDDSVEHSPVDTAYPLLADDVNTELFLIDNDRAWNDPYSADHGGTPLTDQIPSDETDKSPAKVEKPNEQTSAKHILNGITQSNYEEILEVISRETYVGAGYGGHPRYSRTEWSDLGGEVGECSYSTLLNGVHKVVITEGGTRLIGDNIVIGDFDFCDGDGRHVLPGLPFCCAVGGGMNASPIRDVFISMSVGEVALFVFPGSFFGDFPGSVAIRVKVSVLLCEGHLGEEDVLFICNTRNDKARGLYNNNEIEMARTNYVEAVTIIDRCSLEVVRTPSVDELLYRLLNNLASCEMASSKYSSAISISSAILQRHPHNYKSIRRKAIALSKLSYHQEAVGLLEESMGFVGKENIEDAQRTLTFIRSKHKKAQVENQKFFSRAFADSRNKPVESVSAGDSGGSGWGWHVLTTGLIVGAVALFMYFRATR